MASARINVQATCSGVTVSGVVNKTASGFISQDPLIPAAKTGVVSSTPGTMTMTAGHGLAENDVVDVFWEAGCRYGCVVGVVDGNSVPLTGGAGDALPAEATAVTVGKTVSIDCDFVGDNLKMMALGCNQRSHIALLDGASVVLAVELEADGSETWSEGTATNPIAGDTVSSILVSNASALAAAQMKMFFLYDSES